MTLADVIARAWDLPELAVVYADRHGGWRAESRAILLELTDEEEALPIAEVSRTKADGLAYFLEIFNIREVLAAIPDQPLQAQIDRVIYYAVNDA